MTRLGSDPTRRSRVVHPWIMALPSILVSLQQIHIGFKPSSVMLPATETITKFALISSCISDFSTGFPFATTFSSCKTVLLTLLHTTSFCTVYPSVFFLPQVLGMYQVQFFTGYRVPCIKTVFYRVRVPSIEYLTNQKKWKKSKPSMCIVFLTQAVIYAT